MLTRVVCALAAGLALWLSFPAHGVWWCAPLGIAALALATRATTLRRGAALGLIAGMACFVPTLSWSGVYVGALPWFALALLESCYVAAAGGVCAHLQRRHTPRDTPSTTWQTRLLAAALPHHPRPTRADENDADAPASTSTPAPGQPSTGTFEQAPVRPFAVALAWMTSELARGTTPFGGFPWARIAFGQVDGPFLGVAAVLGAPGVTFVTALTGGLIALAVARATTPPAPAHPTEASTRDVTRLGDRWVALMAVAGVVALAAAARLVPLPVDGPPAHVLAIQGNVPQAGLDFNAQRRAVLDNHVKQTRVAAERIAADGGPRPDLVLWPENASDIDPLRNADADAVIRSAVAAVGAPLVVGAVLAEPVGYVSNASLLYEPGRPDVVDRYVKQRPAPFGEYIPYRSFFRLFSDKVDLVTRDFAAGDRVGVFRVPRAGGGTVAAGMTICFEVAFDEVVRANVLHGANLLTVQTNNATFGRTDESVQQLAISRLRAVEHGRSVVHISNVGVSALITPDGTAHAATSLFTATALDGDLPLRTDETIATRLGRAPELAGALALVALVVIGAVSDRRGRRR